MMATAPPRACPVAGSFDPLSPEYLADPYVVLAALPAGGAPVFFSPSIGYYVVTRWRAGISRSRQWSAWASPRTPGSASPPPARSARSGSGQ